MTRGELRRERKLNRRDQLIMKVKEAAKGVMETYDGDCMSITEFVGGLFLVLALFTIVGVAGTIEVTDTLPMSSMIVGAVSIAYLIGYAVIKLMKGE